MDDLQRTHKDRKSDWLVWLQWIFWGQWRAQGLCSCCGDGRKAVSPDWF